MEKIVNMKQQFSMIFHGTALIHHIYALMYSTGKIDFTGFTHPEILNMKHFGYRYFTGWNMFIQLLYLFLAFTHDVLQQTPNRNKKMEDFLKRSKGYVFSSFVFPFTLFVSIMFWSVYTINRDWVMPEICDEIVPKWLNHSLHTNILLVLLVEVFITDQLLPSFKSAFLGMSIITLIYDIVFVYTYFQSGRWLYGLFQVLNWYERIFFMVFNYGASVVAMKLGMLLQKAKGHITIKIGCSEKLE